MIYKRGRYYTVKFKFKGKLIRESTRATDKKTARSIESKIRTELALGNWGILERKPSPTLEAFLKKEFLPYIDNTAKEKTASYYHHGAGRLLDTEMASLPLDQITDQHAGQFAARNSRLSASTINCSLRTLRRALRLAFEWGKLDRMPKINLAQGERQRDRVLTDDEAIRYLGSCRQPWRDAATLILGTGMRPGEAYVLRWEHVVLNPQGGVIRITEGKSKAARRSLPMVPRVHSMMKERHESQGEPAEGWVFPTGSVRGHLEEGTAKTQHAGALAELAKAHKEKPRECPEIKSFEPYCLRHTALTNLAAAGCDAFTLARIAGHSSITITMRYCHPQADAIERAFLQAAN